MKLKLLVFLIAIVHSLNAQVDNKKEVLVSNNVKSVLEKHCFQNSEGSCTIIYSEFDKRGNSILTNMMRMGTIYHDVYDEHNKVIMSIYEHKQDSTRNDTIRKRYDQFKMPIRMVAGPDTIDYQNQYDYRERLIEITEFSIANGETELRKIIRNTFTDFNKIKTKTIMYGEDKIIDAKTTFQYDKQHNLIKRMIYKADTLYKKITYTYDSSNRLIEEIAYDPQRAEDARYMGRNDSKDDFFKTKIKYNQKGQVEELYTYFVDPCMSLNNHFLYSHYYRGDGLLDHADVYEDEKLIFTITFTYEFYE